MLMEALTKVIFPTFIQRWITMGHSIFLEGSSGNVTQSLFQDLILIHLNLQLNEAHLFRYNRERTLDRIQLLVDY